MVETILSASEAHCLEADYIADYTLDVGGDWPTLTVTHYQCFGPNQFGNEQLTTVFRGAAIYAAMDKLSDRDVGRPRMPR